jgi:putative chitinase
MISLIDTSVLRAACPERENAQLEPWVEPIKKACRRFEIDRIRRIAAFLATIAHESGFIPGREEKLNYSAKRMAQVWPGRFARQGLPNDLAKRLAGDAEGLANHVYANRMGNGPPESGDGWRFRGVGPLQLTGRANHEAFAKALDLTIDQAEAYIRTIEGGVMSAAWFWEANDINRLADTPGVTDEAKRINGGTVGLADRERRFNRTVARLLERERGA